MFSYVGEVAQLLALLPNEVISSKKNLVLGKSSGTLCLLLFSYHFVENLLILNSGWRETMSSLEDKIHGFVPLPSLIIIKGLAVLFLDLVEEHLLFVTVCVTSSLH